MTIQTKELVRVFHYNNLVLQDPGRQFTVEHVRDFYANTYPEIVSAAVEGPEEKDGQTIYTFRRAVGTKGAQPDRERGLYGKFHVSRVHDPEGRHANCEYFVLDLEHDKHAAAALEAYAISCGGEFHALAQDLFPLVARIRVKHNLPQPADDEPMTIEFFDWCCGHHGECPGPITGLETDDDVERVLRAISHAISQPGHARARVTSGKQRCEYYLTDDHIEMSEPWEDIPAEERRDV